MEGHRKSNGEIREVIVPKGLIDNLEMLVTKDDDWFEKRVSLAKRLSLSLNSFDLLMAENGIRRYQFKGVKGIRYRVSDVIGCLKPE